ncbi:aminoglycoside phosphotransferase family protein [Kribbella sindirgiensis]|uniref:Aminoglycoside phosphotransferase family protein n=1 Tax=Kribbella sindirgiensis TaxID=1124744 RepID=A0A4R0JEZ9_9ACTN|nr:aminoglycoside phosphotransferase family protein [Kribbella sindirgiensis]TCC43186.1 aminoglycoside phosphotransferase family protein [Kribbella sindirgiensis]
MPSAEGIALAFELGAPDGDLIHVRRGDADTWRLNTSTGSYFVKGYLPAVDVHELTVAMEFERRALASGVHTPDPVMPIDPLIGWVSRVEDQLFRVYRWIEPRTRVPDISTWLGRTMAQVHQLQPLGRAGLPQWWRQAVHPPETWEAWFAETRKRNWRLESDSLPHILAISARIAELCDDVPDLVTTHGDFKTHNIVMSPSGPVLVDWDSVRTDSAALEAGRSAYIFGRGEPEQIKRILTAYVAAGGELGWAGQDLFLSVARNVIQVLAEHIRVALGETTAPRWMGNHTEVETAISNTLRDLPATLDKLHRTTQTLDSL